MSLITRPEKALYNEERNTSTLFFRDSPTLECYMKGGVCWPIRVPQAENEVQGFAILCGHVVSGSEKGKLLVFEERKFITIQHILGKSGLIEWEGLQTFFSEAWKSYYADRFYFNQSMDTYQRYLRDIIRCTMIRSAPLFPKVHWDDLAQAEHLMYEVMTLGTLERNKDSLIHKAMQTYDPAFKQAPPEIHALLCLLSGLQKHPWRDPDEE